MVPPAARADPSADRTAIARSTVWNLVGVTVPIPVAVLAIPALIAGMGAERFGILTIAWALMGYFGVIDFGLSRATTTYLARACHEGDARQARQLFWSSSTVHAVLGCAGGFILFLAAPLLERTLSVDAALRDEAIWSIYLLAASVPVIVLTSVVRGTLEAVHRFDLVNVVKLPASIITYVGPLLALAFTVRLPAVIAVILVGRVAVLATYTLMCFQVLPLLRRFSTPQFRTLRPLIEMGGWITVGTVVTPIIVSVDRIVIASTVSAAAVAAYAAPYEVVTKLWIFSGSLMGVLFPRFSILVENPEMARRLYRHALVALALSTTPVAGLMLALAPEFFQAWLGSEIARDGVVVARWLTVGVLINVMAQVPYTALQASGHADATGKLQIVELLFYAGGVWFAADRWGVEGVAMAWTARAAVDAALMFTAAAYRMGPIHGHRSALPATLVVCASVCLLAWCWQGLSILAPALVPKTLLAVLSAGVYTFVVSRGLRVSLRGATRMLRGQI